MRRRMFLLGLVGLVANARRVTASEDAVAAVRLAYEQMIASDRAGRQLTEDAFLAPFAAETRTLILAARGRVAPGAPEGPVLHACFGPNRRPGQQVTLEAVALRTQRNGTASVVVDIAVLGRVRRIVVDVIVESGAWRIVNLRYPDGQDYASYLRRAAGR